MPQAHHPQRPESAAPSDQGSLRQLLAAARTGQVPTPGQLALALAQARRLVAELAAGLGLDQELPDRIEAGQEALKAYEEALLLCMDLTVLGLDLARSQGPAYLHLPGQSL